MSVRGGGEREEMRVENGEEEEDRRRTPSVRIVRNASVPLARAVPPPSLPTTAAIAPTATRIDEPSAAPSQSLQTTECGEMKSSNTVASLVRWSEWKMMGERLAVAAVGVIADLFNSEKSSSSHSAVAIPLRSRVSRASMASSSSIFSPQSIPVALSGLDSVGSPSAPRPPSSGGRACTSLKMLNDFSTSRGAASTSQLSSMASPVAWKSRSRSV